jgi:hypothetical protein
MYLSLYNIHPATDDVAFTFQTSTDSGSNYGVTLTSTAFHAYHNEADTATNLTYYTSRDLAQSTSFQILGEVGNDNDQSVSGTLQLFNPSSTTYVKHFIATSSMSTSSDYLENQFYGGYFNTTSAINAVQFKMASGNIDDGIIKLYGVK